MKQNLKGINNDGCGNKIPYYFLLKLCNLSSSFFFLFFWIYIYIYMCVCVCVYVCIYVCMLVILVHIVRDALYF